MTNAGTARHQNYCLTGNMLREVPAHNANS